MLSHRSTDNQRNRKSNLILNRRPCLRSVHGRLDEWRKTLWARTCAVASSWAFDWIMPKTDSAVVKLPHIGLNAYKAGFPHLPGFCVPNTVNLEIVLAPTSAASTGFRSEQKHLFDGPFQRQGEGEGSKFQRWKASYWLVLQSWHFS